MGIRHIVMPRACRVRIVVMKSTDPRMVENPVMVSPIVRRNDTFCRFACRVTGGGLVCWFYLDRRPGRRRSAVKVVGGPIVISGDFLGRWAAGSQASRSQRSPVAFGDGARRVASGRFRPTLPDERAHPGYAGDRPSVLGRARRSTPGHPLTAPRPPGMFVVATTILAAALDRRGLDVSDHRDRRH